MNELQAIFQYINKLLGPPSIEDHIFSLLQRIEVLERELKEIKSYGSIYRLRAGGSLTKGDQDSVQSAIQSQSIGGESIQAPGVDKGAQ